MRKALNFSFRWESIQSQIIFQNVSKVSQQMLPNIAVVAIFTPEWREAQREQEHNRITRTAWSSSKPQALRFEPYRV